MKNLFFALLLTTCIFSCNSEKMEKIDADNANIYYTGRIDFSDPKAVKYCWPGVSIKAKFEGKKCTILLNHYHFGMNEYGKEMHNYYNLIVDGKLRVLKAANKDSSYSIDSLSDGIHTLELFKRTEGFVGYGEFKGFELEKGKKLLPIEHLRRKIEFIGNSITCGYGNEGESEYCHFIPALENHYMAYAAITARNLNAEHHTIAFSGKGLYRNYNNTTYETMPDLYDRIFVFDSTVKWNFTKWTPDIVVINLGTNDFAGSNPDSTTWVTTYLNFIKTIRKHYPDAFVFCTNGPMTNDEIRNNEPAVVTLTRYINTVVSIAHSNGDNKIASHFYPPQTPPFGCNYHPGIKTHQKMAEELTALIKQKLNW